MTGDSKVWRNRIVGYSEEPPDQLLANPSNWRVHSERQQEAMAGALAEVGVVQNVVVNRTTGHVVDGHLRIALALRNGQPTVPVTWIEVSEAEERLILATFDPIGALAEMDAEALDALLQEVEADDDALRGLLDELADDAGLHADDPPTLDELADKYGEPGERDFWPVIRVVVAPETMERWQSLMAQIPTGDEAEKVRVLLAAVDESALEVPFQEL